ncbi:MFS transporter [Deinococcus ficus]|uniref:MFS transporter n=1 Tax=Deinococcus ficus TaxID=317577 RepID=A0A221T0W3_9DEIO|nr:MFS transporter [Deinococcus ficus]ASN82538.1 MFS transporter [Deinococcus ficus]
MNSLLWRGEFARLWWGGLINAIGTWMTGAALPVYVYTTTESVPAAGAMALAATLPGVLLGSSAGVIADRFDRRAVLVVTNLLAALSLLPLLFVGTQGLWVVYLSAVLKALVTLPTGPARSALLPALVPEAQLAQANALNALNNNLARLVGPALGGLIFAAADLSSVVVLDLVTYLVAAAFIASLTPHPVAAGPREAVRAALTAGWRAVRVSPALLTLVLYLAVTSIGEGVFGVLLAPFVTHVLGGDALAFGWVLSAQAIGGVVGGALVARHAGRVAPLRLWVFGAAGLGLADLAIFLYPLAWPGVGPALALMVLAGVPASAAGAGWMTLAQHFTDDAVRGRVFGLAGQLSGVGLLLGLGLATLAGQAAPITALLCVHSALLMLGGLGAWVVWRSRQLDRLPAGAAPATAA